MRFHVFGKLASVSGCVFACALPAVAQTTAQIPLQFDFLAPGARSMALGSAFTARADDATAAFTNPAGLVMLFEPEVSFELRYRRNETPFLAAGRISGTITGIGEDTIQGPVFGTSVDRGIVPSFASFAYARKRLAVAAYRHQLVELQNAFLYRGVFERVTFAGESTDRARDLPLGGERELAIASYGASVAYRLGRGERISIGGGVSLSTFDLSSDFARFDFDGVFGSVNTSITTATATQRGSDTGWAVNGGVLWQVHRKLSVGTAYRRGPSFSFEQDDRRPLREPLVRTGRFKVPDVFTLGGLWRPMPTLSVSVDYARVAYSQLLRTFVELQAVSSGRERQLSIDDGHEWHVGAEWVVRREAPQPTLRGGAWRDPDHAVRYIPDGTDPALDLRLTTILPGGRDLVHYTFGAGASLSKRFEINAAADLTSRSRHVSVSGIVRLSRHQP